ncbi:MAG: PAS domain S-box protein [Alicyclobacillus sp.]|nr:PAS domain S-box protein [Alicyclobacillus sp.]
MYPADDEGPTERKTRRVLPETCPLEVLERISDGYFALDTEWRFTYINPAGCRLLRRRREELLGQCVWDEFAEARDTLFWREYHRAMAENVPVRFTEYYAPLATWYEARAYPSEAGLAVYFLDVTDTVELHKRDQLVQHAQRIAHLGIWEWDIVNDTILWSEGARRIGHHPIASGRLHDFLEHMVHPEDRDAVRTALAAALRGHPYDIEYRFLRPSGEVRFVHSQGEVWFDPSGRAQAMIGVAYDVTQRKRAEQQLRESQERYEAVIQSVRDGIIVIDEEGKVLTWNRGAELILGYPAKERLGRPLADIIPERWRAAHQAGLQNAVASGRVCHSGVREVVARHQNGEEVPLELTVSAWQASGRTYFTGVIRDIRERKHTERLLVQAEKLSAVGQLAAGIAHEIRNPLTALKGFLQWLQTRYPDVPERYFDLLLGEISRIEAITNELLALAKPRDEAFRVHNLGSVLESVVAVLASEALLHNINIRTELSPAPPVLAEEHQLKQVFVNLLKNAMEAMPGGGEVTVRLSSARGEVRVDVEDNGTGMPPEVVDRLGDPFFTTKPGGTGLGWMVTRRIIEHHRGEIAVESSLGAGTRVTVRLPAAAHPASEQ